MAMENRMSRRLYAFVVALGSSCLLAQAALAGINFVGGDVVTVAPKPDIMLTGDINNDQRADIVVIAPNSKEVDVYVADNTSPSHFAPVRVTHLGQSLTGATLADINNDGNLDVLITDKGTDSFWVMLGKGDGTFLTPYQVAIPDSRHPVAIAAGNFDQTGNTDVVVADDRENKLFILLNDNGTPPHFRRGGEIDIGLGPTEVLAVDMNNDGKLDLVALNSGGPRVKEIAVSLWKRVAQGFPEFDTPQRFGAGVNPSNLIARDFNNDGNLDLVMLNHGAGSTAPNEINLMLGQGNGVLLPPSIVLVPCPFFAPGNVCRYLGLVAGDFDGNGTVDLVIGLTDPRRSAGSTTAANDAMQAFGGDGHGSFAPGAVFSTLKGLNTMAASDITGSRKLDITVANNRTLNVQVFVNVSKPGGAGNGDQCSLGDECLSNRCTNGVCCAAQCDVEGGEVCNIAGREGTCVPIPVAPTACTLPNAPECTQDEFCVDGYCCDQMCQGGHCNVQGFLGVCIPGLPLGETCDTNERCSSGFCSQNFVCCQEQCDNGYCDENGVCTARLPNGDDCTNDFDCLSNVCDTFDLICCNRRCDANTERCFLEDGVFKGRCVSLDFQTPTPTNTKAPTPTNTPGVNLTPGVVGAACSTPSQCDNNQCVNGVCCSEPACGDNQHCQQGTGDCVDGPAGTATPVPTFTKTPNACSDQCSTSHCINGACVVSSHSGGCSVSDEPNSSGAALLLVLPLALWTVRRRQLRRVRVAARAPRQ
jgi:hypothetical protein